MLSSTFIHILLNRAGGNHKTKQTGSTANWLNNLTWAGVVRIFQIPYMTMKLGKMNKSTANAGKGGQGGFGQSQGSVRARDCFL